MMDDTQDMTYDEHIKAVAELNHSQGQCWKLARRLLEEAFDRHQDADGRDGPQALSQTIQDYDLVTQREREALDRICPISPEASQEAELDAHLYAAQYPDRV